jgi:hypothetical protein
MERQRATVRLIVSYLPVKISSLRAFARGSSFKKRSAGVEHKRIASASFAQSLRPSS